MPPGTALRPSGHHFSGLLATQDDHMSDAATRILKQLQTQNDLRMQTANDIAQAVDSRVHAENALTEAKANKKSAFDNALKKGSTQQELNEIGPARATPK